MAFQWTKPRTTAAALLADDTLTDEQIAARLGITPRALWYWKAEPEFRARVTALAEQHQAKVAAALVTRGIAERQNRVDALNDRWYRMRQVIEDRAADDTMKGAGSKTGLLVRTYKQVGRGRTAEEYAVDTGLLKELRAHEQQAAQELGQWLERQQQDVSVSGDLTVQFIPAVPRLEEQSGDGGRD